MKNLTATICLTIAVLLGSAGVSWSADNETKTKKKIINTEFSFEISAKTPSESGLKKTLTFFRDEKAVLSKTIWGNVVAQTSDINGDQREEVVVAIYGGGNCCAPDLFLYFVDTQTNKLKEVFFDKWRAWQGWDDVSIAAVDNVATLMNTDNHVGANPNLARSDVSYRFNGRNVRLSAVVKHKKIPALEELESTDFDTDSNDHEQKKNLKFDLNSDGEDEIFSCGYWMRWGELIGCSVMSEKYGNVFRFSQNTGLGKRFGVLPEKQNGWHVLVVDFNERWIFDPKLNQYKKGE